MVLLAGDLFHENKPSRKSMYQVMRSLRMNCLGEKPCELEMLSDASEAFQGYLRGYSTCHNAFYMLTSASSGLSTMSTTKIRMSTSLFPSFRFTATMTIPRAYVALAPSTRMV